MLAIIYKCNLLRYKLQLFFVNRFISSGIVFFGVFCYFLSMRTFSILPLICSLFILEQNCGVPKPAKPSVERIDKIEMNLSAFGVESVGFPNIRVQGPTPLRELYRLVYKLDVNFRP